MRVLFASSEIYPYAKSGGLADVADALPKALSSLTDMLTVMPLYSFISKKGLTHYKSFKINLNKIDYKINIYTKSDENIKRYFVEAPLLSTTQNSYCDENGDYKNNDLRFGLFCMTIVELCVILKIDILHLNDWHTALCSLFIKERMLNIKTILTIHNLAYQGIFDKKSLKRLEIDKKYFTMESLEFYGNISFLKAGIVFSDKITTVSPTYAKEILTKEFGCGLEGFLAHHKDKLSGILNGINESVFNPSKDDKIYLSYDKKSIENKYKNKVEFIKKSKLKDQRHPLFVMITRLVEQKGINLVLKSLKRLLDKKINIFILGEGNKEFAKKLEKFSKEHDNFYFYNGYDESLSHCAYAAADFLLMPSKFEPCGLNQMIAMRYGAMPIVHSVGGLKDSVHEQTTKCGSGIVFNKHSKKEFIAAVERALKLKKDKKKFQSLIKFNMECDFSFKTGALKYFKLYIRVYHDISC